MSLEFGPTSKFYYSQRLRLHYVDWGNAEAPPLLLVHGGRDHCRNWDWVARELSQHYHVIAPDLRGHGDSQWITGGTYNMIDYTYDIAQLIHQLELAPLHIVAHSMGGSVSLRYAGLYPENVEKLVAIEGLGPSPKMLAEWRKQEPADSLRNWVDQVRGISGRQPRRYETLADATLRMQEANPHLSPQQAQHLTVHGANQNEDGSFSWKYDNYINVFQTAGITPDLAAELYSKITCPTLLVYGEESDASNPALDGRAKVFQDVQIETISNAGHWVHHDQLQVFLKMLEKFL